MPSEYYTTLMLDIEIIVMKIEMIEQLIDDIYLLIDDMERVHPHISDFIFNNDCVDMDLTSD